MFYTKWKRNLLDDADREGYFKEIEKNKLQQRVLARYMRSVIKRLAIPLYDGFKNIQFHDTLNGIIRFVYEYLHEKYVNDRIKTIETKIRVGTELHAFERINVGDTRFWLLKPI